MISNPNNNTIYYIVLLTPQYIVIACKHQQNYAHRVSG